MNTVLQCCEEDLEMVFTKFARKIIDEVRAIPVEPLKVQRGGMELFCEVTGLSESYGYKATSGKITTENPPPFKKFGSKIVFDRAELEKWINSKTVNPNLDPNKVTDAITESARKKTLVNQSFGRTK